MLNKLKKSNSEGFTIIEVMIVLAIAGLIILIVLLAVPALQRNSRNTAIKNDASALSAAVTEFASNNDGSIPTAGGSSQAGSTVTLNNAAGNAATAKVQGSTTVGFSAVWPATSGAINVAYGQKCTAANAITASPRSTAILFRTEGAGGATVQQCVDA
jgi:prepilin-type N-terminal cleavage/methylation domain-containing protein